MAQYRTYPLPSTQMREMLAMARDQGVDFETAWSNSFRSVRWPYSTKERTEWKTVLEEGQKVWAECYAGTGENPVGAAVKVLGEKVSA